MDLTGVLTIQLQSMIKQMITIDPSGRPTFDSLLHTTRGTVFPETFYSFLHNYVASVNELASGSPFSFPSHLPSVSATPISNTSAGPKLNINPSTPGIGFPTAGDPQNEPLPSDSDHRMERIWADYESVEPYILTPLESESLEQTVKEPVRVKYTSAVVGSGRALQVRPRVFHA